MENEETLLPLHREFTEKELHELCKQHRAELKLQVKKLKKENQRLISQAEDLKKQLVEWSAEIPSAVDPKQTVSGKTYNKARKQYTDMVAAFWRVNDELRDLKKKINEEKL